MNRSELLQSLKEACDRQETTMTSLANQLYVAKNTLSSWFSEQSKEIPFNNLVNLSLALNDEYFIEDVKCYMFKYDTRLKKITNNNVAAIYLRQQKEERDRIALTTELEEVLSVSDEEAVKAKVREKALYIYKELFEEVNIEKYLIIAFKARFGFTEHELKKVGVVND